MADIKDPENTLVMGTSKGDVVIALRPDIAPGHVARIKELVRSGFYDGVRFHRVIDGFMAQTGDPNSKGASRDSWGTGGSGKKLKAEFSDAKHQRGTVSMARSSDPNSGDSQFFICFDEAPHLNEQYTVWGTVIDGMQHVDKIAKGEPPKEPDRIVSMRVAADAA